MRPLPSGRRGPSHTCVHIADAAEATVAAVERGSRGVYNVVDEDPAPGRRVAAGAQITSISSIVNPTDAAAPAFPGLITCIETTSASPPPTRTTKLDRGRRIL
jgi:nucleoside-diphosphate-sugar epimerase